MMSSLTGLVMTMADSGVSELDVFGPSGLNHFLASTRLYTMRFVQHHLLLAAVLTDSSRESLSIKPHEISSSSPLPVYADENLSVYSVPVLPEYNAPSDRMVGGSLKRKRPDCDMVTSNKKERMAGGDSFGDVNADSSETLDSSVWH